MCAGCGRKVKAKHRVCRKCGMPNPRRSVKGAAAGAMFVTKSGRPRCPNPACRTAAKYADQLYCVRCGGGMLAGVHKSAELGLLTKITAEHDPAARERLYRATFPLYGPGNGGAA